MPKLKLQYLGHLMWRTDSLEKTLMLGKIKVGREGDYREWDGWMASPTWWTWVWVNPGSWCWTGRPGELQSMGSWRVWYDWVTKLNWTELNSPIPIHFSSLIPKILMFTLAISSFSSVAQSCPTLCHPMNRSTSGLPVYHQLLQFTQTHAHWVSDAIMLCLSNNGLQATCSKISFTPESPDFCTKISWTRIQGRGQRSCVLSKPLACICYTTKFETQEYKHGSSG